MRINIKNKLVLFLFFSYSSVVCSNSINEALIADKNNNSKEAVEIWAQLASRGNTSAMYNLASHYSSGKGIVKNKVLSDEWLDNATRSGLIQAYLNLNNNAVTPASYSHLTFKTGPLYWLEKQKPGKYTLQLISGRNKKLVEKIYNDNNLKGKAGYLHYMRSGKDNYALVYGVYETVAAAKAAITKLPENLRKSSPWVRKIKSLHEISQ